MSVLSLEELTKDIPPSHLERKCSERYLAKIAQKLKSWELLRPHLAIDTAEAHSIERSGNYDEQKQCLLLKWKQKHGKSATYKALLNAIWEMEDVSLVQYACEMIREQDIAESVDDACAVAEIPPAAILEYKNSLKSSYASHNPIVVEDWPPPPLQEYVKVVLVPKEPIEMGPLKEEEILLSACGIACGNIDDSTAGVELYELLKPSTNQRKVVLFEGPSGSGKSTLFWHICQKWQSGELLQQFALVLLVQLRDKAIQEAHDLTGILPFLPSRSRKALQIQDRYVSGIEDIHGEGVLLLLDGWDEAPAKLRQRGSFLHDLISSPSKCSIEKSVIAVSSRPLASHSLRKYSTSRVELCGFTKESRDHYIKRVLELEEAEKLIKEIESAGDNGAIDLNHPMNVVNLTHIFKASDFTLPSTPCRITITLLCCYLLRHINKKYDETRDALHSLDDLPHPINEVFQKLCKVAYDGLVEQRYSFSTEEIQNIPAGLDPSRITELGVLQSVHSLVSTGTSTQYHFLHLSFQYLCAAHYVFKLTDPERTHAKALEMLLVSHTEPGEMVGFLNFESVSIYYSALTSLSNLNIARQMQAIYHLYEEKRESHFKKQQERIMKLSVAEFIHPGEVFCNDHVTDSDKEIVSESLRLEAKLHEESCDVHETDSDEERISESLRLEAKPHEDNFFEKVKDELKDACVIFGNGKSYKCPTFVEFLFKSQNSAFVDEMIGKEIKMQLFQSEAAFIALVDLVSTLESVTCFSYNFSEAMGVALSRKRNMREFKVHILKPVVEIAEFQGVLRILESCHYLKIITINARFMFEHYEEYHRNEVEAANKLAHALQIRSLEKLTITSHSLKDEGIIAIASVIPHTKTFSLQCKAITRRQSFEKLAENILRGQSLTHFELLVQDYSGEDEAFFRCLKNAISLTTVNILNTNDSISIKHTSIGRALLSGDLRKLASVVGLSEPPAVDKIMSIHIFEHSQIEVDFKKSVFVTIKTTAKYEGKCDGTFPFYDIIWINEHVDVGTLNLTAREFPVNKLHLCAHRINKMRELSFQNIIACLEELELPGCSIGEDGIKLLFESLKENSTLLTLGLRNTDLGDNGAVKLAAVINHTSIQYLDISHCSVKEEGMLAIITALETNRNLRKFHAADNQLGDSGAVAMAEAINNTSLEALDISNCQVGERGMVAIASALTTNKSITFLKLDSNHEITQCSELAFTKMLLRNTTLKSMQVNIPLFHVHQDTAQTLQDESASDFYHDIKMSSIILIVETPSSSGLGQALWSGNMKEAEEILQLHQPPSGVSIICLRMSTNSWLVDYDRRTIEEKDEGLIEMRRILSRPETWANLTRLDLSSKRLGNVGACLLAELLNKTQLQDLDVSSCNIGEEGIIKLAHALSTNTTIKCLAIGGNMISDKGLDALFDALSENKILSTLNFPHKFGSTIHMEYYSKKLEELSPDSTLEVITWNFPRFTHRQKRTVSEMVQLNMEEAQVPTILRSYNLDCGNWTHL